MSGWCARGCVYVSVGLCKFKCNAICLETIVKNEHKENYDHNNHDHNHHDHNQSKKSGWFFWTIVTSSVETIPTCLLNGPLLKTFNVDTQIQNVIIYIYILRTKYNMNQYDMEPWPAERPRIFWNPSMRRGGVVGASGLNFCPRRWDAKGPNWVNIIKYKYQAISLFGYDDLEQPCLRWTAWSMYIVRGY